MKKFALIPLLTSLFFVQTPCIANTQEDLINIVKTDYIDSIYFNQIIQAVSAAVMDETGLEMPLDELVKKVSEMIQTEEVLAKLYKPYEDNFTAEEIHTISEYANTDAAKKQSAKSIEIFHNYAVVSKELIGAVLTQNGVKPPAELNSQSSIVAITEDNFSHEVESQQSGDVIFVVSAPWCGACKKLKPVLERVSAKYADSIKFALANADTTRPLIAKLKVKALPTVFLFRNGKQLHKFVGYIDDKAFDEVIQNVFKKK